MPPHRRPHGSEGHRNVSDGRTGRAGERQVMSALGRGCVKTVLHVALSQDLIQAERL